MKLNIFLSLSILTTLISCSGHNSSRTIDKPTSLTIGDTVNKLGNNIMSIYQDTKNNYWFGSWEDGRIGMTEKQSFILQPQAACLTTELKI